MSAKKTKKENNQLIVRIDKQERAEFVGLWEELDTSAAREVRRFIREFITELMSNSKFKLKPKIPMAKATAKALKKEIKNR
ncbi:hypothetical protein [Paraglaciecola polaris]|uniref:Uncharacterized protein n=1 Tax=Paraglaciecola polaris LMG 21857 TaxID=1129793 RepID=K7A8Y4_9ALTE|nr:hypothetical protein [Paraglaciecola polaris]GAC31875.1 hypothetical protein GPLA_0959 [Paraglaciecola polaris LMG 21857]